MMELSSVVGFPQAPPAPDASITAASTPAQVVQGLQGLTPPLWSLRALRGLVAKEAGLVLADPAKRREPPSPAALFDLQLVLYSLSPSARRVWDILVATPHVTMEVWRACLGPSASPADIAALAQCAAHTPAALALPPTAVHETLVLDAETHLVTAASLPALVDLMLREEYRLVEPRIVEVVLMTHTVFAHSTDFLKLLLQHYDSHRSDSNTLGRGGRDLVRVWLTFAARTMSMDAIGYWFCSPLYLRPDHMTDGFVGSWQEYVSSLISAGTIRESEKAMFRKFTHLLATHYARLEALVAERAARPEPQPAKRPVRMATADVALVAAAIVKTDWALFADIQPYELFGNVRAQNAGGGCGVW